MKKLALAAAVAMFTTPALAGQVTGTPGPAWDWVPSYPTSFYAESYEVEGPSNDRGRVGTPRWSVERRDIPDNVGVDRGDNGSAGAGASGDGAGSNGGSDSGGDDGGDGGEGPGGSTGGPGNGNGNSPNSGNGGGNTNGSGPGTGNNGANNGRGHGAGNGGGGSGNGGR